MTYPNIERSGFRRGEYVGYTQAGRTAYTMRIRRGGQGWETYFHEPLAKAAGGCFTYATTPTLRQLSERLAAMTHSYER